VAAAAAVLAVVSPVAVGSRAVLPGVNGRIAFQQGGTDNAPATPNAEVFTISSAGKTLRRLTKNRSYDGNPAWSPDGKTIAFESARRGDNDVFTMDSAGKHVHELTFAEGDDGNPAWSPDGSQLVFQSSRLGTYDLWVMDANGRNQHVVAGGAGDQIDPQWSENGSLVYTVVDASGAYSIWTSDADGTGATKVSSSAGVNKDPAWSPDGSKIAFESNRGGCSPQRSSTSRSTESATPRLSARSARSARGFAPPSRSTAPSRLTSSGPSSRTSGDPGWDMGALRG
jgi:Tol biopolymer transport system component